MSQTPQETITEMADALQRGVNYFEIIGRFYCQIQTQNNALSLALGTLQAMQQASEAQTPEAVPEEMSGGDIPDAGPDGEDVILHADPSPEG